MISNAIKSQNDLFIKFKPNQLKYPKHDCLIIDVSGSTGSSALITDEHGNKVPTDFSYLDLIKHCLNVYIHSLSQDENDNLVTIIIFNNKAYPIIESKIVNNETKDEIIDRIMRFRSGGGTNIWDGIKNGYDIMKGSDNNYFKKMVLFTDGLPNNNPDRGIIYTLNKYISDNEITNIPLHILGFGYQLEISTMTEICKITGGSYNYIPSSAEIVTVMVHLIGNLLMKVNKGLTLTLSFENNNNNELDTICKYLKMYNYQIYNDTSIIINIGQISNDTILYFPNINQIPQIKYELETDIMEFDDIKVSELNDEELNNEFLNARFRNIIIDRVLQMYTNSISDRIHKNEEVYQDLLKELDVDNRIVREYEKDITGEIKMGLLDAENFRKWGIYYIPSIMGSYQRYECNSSRDIGIQTFCTEEFNELKDELYDLCEILPDPTPSLIRENNGYNRSYTNNYPTPEQSQRVIPRISDFANHGGCWHGKCVVKIPNGLKSIEFIKKGDKIINSDGDTSIVECVIRHKCPNNKKSLSNIGGLFITQYHPVIINSEWVFPIDKGELKDMECDYVYNFILNDRKSIYVNNIICCTLGHGLEGPIIGHPFFGTEKIVNNLKLFTKQYDKGLIDSPTEHRDPETNLISKYSLD